MFWERFYKLCIEKGTKPNPVAREIGVSSGVVTKWKNGSIPTPDALIKIADYFDVSVDYLLGKTDTKKASPPSEDAISEIERKIRDDIKLLSEEDAEKAIEYIDFLIARGKQKNSKDNLD